MGLFYDNVTKTIGRTPLVQLQRLAPKGGATILVKLEGIDSSANPGDQVNRFKGALATNAYFKEMLAKTNAVSLKNLSPPQVAPISGKPCVMFTLECRYPEKTR